MADILHTNFQCKLDFVSILSDNLTKIKHNLPIKYNCGIKSEKRIIYKLGPATWKYILLSFIILPGKHSRLTKLEFIQAITNPRKILFQILSLALFSFHLSKIKC